MFQKFGQMIWGFIGPITGLSVILDRWDTQPWLVFALLFCLVMTIVAFFRLIPQFVKSAAELTGGFFIWFIWLALMFAGFGIMIGVVFGFGSVAISSALAQIAFPASWPLVGGWPGNWLVAIWEVVAIFVFVAVLLVIGYTVIKSMGRYITKGTDKLEQKLEAWQDPKGFLEEVKWTYAVAPILVIAGGLCHPTLNEALYYLPAGAGALTGILTLIFANKHAKKAMEKAKSKWKGEDAEGNPLCRNKRYIFNTERTAIRLIGVKGFVTFDVAKKLMEEGVKPELEVCNTPMKPGDSSCPHFACNGDNPGYPQSCVNRECERFGKRDIEPDRVKCPTCAHPLPKRNPTPGPIFPDEDKHSREEGEPAPATPPATTAPPSGTPEPPPPAPPPPALTWSCPHCGHPNQVADPFCGKCGAKLQILGNVEKKQKPKRRGPKRIRLDSRGHEHGMFNRRTKQ
jgi:hypothetical protein